MTDSFADTKRELYETMQRIRHDRFAMPTPDGVTPAEARAMLAICRLEERDGPIRPGRVAEIAQTTPSALSQTFKSLEEKGLIERSRAADDYRAVTVRLTEEGGRFAAQCKRAHNDLLDQVMAYLGEEDVAHLVRILKKTIDFRDLHLVGAEGLAYGESGKGGDAPCA